jgi:hypothetical protein
MEDPENAPPLPAAPENRPRMSLLARLLNVFAVPGEVFADMRTSPHAPSNWLLPAILGAIVGVISVFALLSQPSIQKQFRDRQTRMIDAQIKAGKMTPQEQKIAERFTGPAVLKAVGGAGAVIGSFLSVLWWGFVLWWLARRMLKVPVSFAKTLEVAGLAMMINVLGGIIALLLMVNFGSIGATPSLALMVKDFDTTRKSHLFAAAANVFSFWVVGVRAIGLAKLTEVSYLRAAWLVVTFWVLQQSIFVLSGLGQLAM